MAVTYAHQEKKLYSGNSTHANCLQSSGKAIEGGKKREGKRQNNAVKL